VARNLPIGFYLVGSYPPVESALPMSVSPRGDIYLTTMNRGIIMLKKTK